MFEVTLDDGTKVNLPNTVIRDGTTECNIIYVDCTDMPIEKVQEYLTILKTNILRTGVHNFILVPTNKDREIKVEQIKIIKE